VPAGAAASSPARGWLDYLARCRAQLENARALATYGRLTRVTGLVMEAVGLRLPLGATCLVSQPPHVAVEAEVVGFSAERLFLMPVSDTHGLTPGAVVTPHEAPARAPKPGARGPAPRAGDAYGKRLPAGDALLGRVVDAAGRALDGGAPLDSAVHVSLSARPVNPIRRAPIREPLDVGVRAINALLTVGRGQRMGLFAGSGVGKSVLLGMMARYTAAEVIVVGLIGERGREVKEFVEEILGPEGLQRATVVAAPADVSPLLRLQGAAYATALAEEHRDRGRNVLLIMDSLTRYAMAQREIALAIGEPPATKGYPPSVFARLPQLVERAGNGEGGGSLSAFYTVLTEGDDPQDPIADAARAILDGHIVLSRALAEQGHYPAIDVEQSVSRTLQTLAGAEHLERARRFRALAARHQRNRDLISVGAYVAGSDPLLDRAIAAAPRMETFLQQDMRLKVGMRESLEGLARAVAEA
jgi:flagellum-specific ATP synthase